MEKNNFFYYLILEEKNGMFEWQIRTEENSEPMMSFNKRTRAINWIKTHDFENDTETVEVLAHGHNKKYVQRYIRDLSLNKKYVEVIELNQTTTSKPKSKKVIKQEVKAQKIEKEVAKETKPKKVTRFVELKEEVHSENKTSFTRGRLSLSSLLLISLVLVLLILIVVDISTRYSGASYDAQLVERITISIYVFMSIIWAVVLWKIIKLNKRKQILVTS